MYSSFSLVLTAFLGLLFIQGSLSQRVSIASPASGTTVKPGQQLTIVLRAEGTTSSVKRIAFSTGFKTTKQSDPTSIGRPYVSTVFPGSNVSYDPSKGTYTYTITVPIAREFLDGFPATYHLTVAQYYLLGATNTPTLQLAETQVQVST